MRHRSEHRRAERPLVAALYQRRIDGRRQIRRQSARGGAQHMIDHELQNHRNTGTGRVNGLPYRSALP